MLAMNKFVTQAEVLFRTTNNPRELPNRAMRKITAYAIVMPILISAVMLLAGCCCTELEMAGS